MPASLRNGALVYVDVMSGLLESKGRVADPSQAPLSLLEFQGPGTLGGGAVTALELAGPSLCLTRLMISRVLTSLNLAFMLSPLEEGAVFLKA